MEYIAFGEVLFEEHSSSFSSPYLFNGKELDRETNLSYYCARYYDAKTSLWLNVDPKAEKMSNFGVYVFTFNNPVKFIDPDGKEPTPYEAALMSSHVYDGKVKLAGGWVVSKAAGKDFKFESDSGFKSALYERKVNGKTEYTYATAGTEASWADVGADTKQPLGLSNQYKESKKRAQELKKILGKAEITYTGHSLGGGLAETNAITTGDKAITFNAAGVSPLTASGKTKTTAFIMTTDPLNLIQQGSIIPTAGGRKQLVSPRTLGGWYNGHSIDNMIDALKVIKDGGDYKLIEVMSKKWSDIMNK